MESTIKCITNNMIKKKGRPKIEKDIEKSRLLAFRLSEKELLKLKELSVTFQGNISAMIRYAFKKTFAL